MMKAQIRYAAALLTDVFMAKPTLKAMAAWDSPVEHHALPRMNGCDATPSLENFSGTFMSKHDALAPAEGIPIGMADT